MARNTELDRLQKMLDDYKKQLEEARIEVLKQDRQMAKNAEMTLKQWREYTNREFANQHPNVMKGEYDPEYAGQFQANSGIRSVFSYKPARQSKEFEFSDIDFDKLQTGLDKMIQEYRDNQSEYGYDLVQKQLDMALNNMQARAVFQQLDSVSPDLKAVLAEMTQEDKVESKIYGPLENYLNAEEVSQKKTAFREVKKILQDVEPESKEYEDLQKTIEKSIEKIHKQMSDAEKRLEEAEMSAKLMDEFVKDGPEVANENKENDLQAAQLIKKEIQDLRVQLQKNEAFQKVVAGAISMSIKDPEIQRDFTKNHKKEIEKEMEHGEQAASRTNEKSKGLVTTIKNFVHQIKIDHEYNKAVKEAKQDIKVQMAKSPEFKTTKQKTVAVKKAESDLKRINEIKMKETALKREIAIMVSKKIKYDQFRANSQINKTTKGRGNPVPIPRTKVGRMINAVKQRVDLSNQQKAIDTWTGADLKRFLNDPKVQRFLEDSKNDPKLQAMQEELKELRQERGELEVDAQENLKSIRQDMQMKFNIINQHVDQLNKMDHSVTAGLNAAQLFELMKQDASLDISNYEEVKKVLEESGFDFETDGSAKSDKTRYTNPFRLTGDGPNQAYIPPVGLSVDQYKQLNQIMRNERFGISDTEKIIGALERVGFDVSPYVEKNSTYQQNFDYFAQQDFTARSDRDVNNNNYGFEFENEAELDDFEIGK